MPKRVGKDGNDTGGIKAIETHYNGMRFRSRLEARWAVFFDAIGIRYEYEPEGYTAKDGTCYLPDFYLPDEDVYVEVKPFREGVREELVKPVKFCEKSERLVLFLPNLPPDCEDPMWWFPIMYYHPLKRQVIANLACFVIYGSCASLEMGVDPSFICTYYTHRFLNGDGAKYMLEPKNDLDLPYREIYTGVNKGDYCRFSDFPYGAEKLRAAFTAARTARFEYGETPKA